MWVRNSFSGVTPFAQNRWMEIKCRRWDHKWDGLVHFHNQDLLKSCESEPTRTKFLVAILALERATPIYEMLMGSEEVAANRRPAFEKTRTALSEWAYGKREIDHGFQEEVEYSFGLALKNPLSGLFHAFGAQPEELLRQIADDRPDDLSFPVVFNFDIIRSMVGDHIHDGAKVRAAFPLAKRLGSREAERQREDAVKLKGASLGDNKVFDELVSISSSYDLLDGEAFPSLIKK